jgi:ABC-type transporter Mla subunit MlaD
VNSSPPPNVQPQVWTAPNVSGNGHITVHRDALTSASDVVKRHLQALDDAINRVNAHSNAFDSLMTWATGSDFAGNLSSAVQGFALTSQQTSDAHAATAQNLSDTASTYEEAETSSTQAVGTVNAPSSGSGSVSAGSGNWS